MAIPNRMKISSLLSSLGGWRKIWLTRPRKVKRLMMLMRLTKVKSTKIREQEPERKASQQSQEPASQLTLYRALGIQCLLLILPLPPGPATIQDQYRAGFFVGATHSIYVKDLPPEPTNWSELKSHPYRAQFHEASQIEWASVKASSVRLVPRAEANGHYILPLTWVWKYKEDEDGYLTGFKARICVRGDQQPRSDMDTYAATLASTAFRILAACICKYDLETRQYDTINAFTNSDLDELVYTQLPPGFGIQGWICILTRALYGLRRSALLWHQDLSSTLKSLGLEQGSGGDLYLP